MKTSFKELYGQEIATDRPNYGDSKLLKVAAVDEVLRVDIALPEIEPGDEYRLRFQLVDNTLVTAQLNIREDGTPDPLASKKVTSSNPKVDLIVDSDDSGREVFGHLKATAPGNTKVNISFYKQ